MLLRSILTATRLRLTCTLASTSGHRRCAHSPAQFVELETTDPFLLLATEEALAAQRAFPGHTMIVARMRPCVMIGRHQNPWKECDLSAMNAASVELVRRRSGGGAVYQDLGTANFGFLSPVDLASKARNFGIVIDALRSLNIDAQVTGRNDIELAGGRKVSGSAFRSHGAYLAHHGTLLVDTDLEALARYLHPHRLKLQSKGIDSVRARVANLTSVRPGLQHAEVTAALLAALQHTYGPASVTRLTESMLLADERIRGRRAELADWHWRYGQSPPFTHTLERRFDWGLLEVCVRCDRGRVADVRVYSDALLPDMIDVLQAALAGTPYAAASMAAAAEHAALLYDEAHEARRALQQVADWLRAESLG